MKSILLLTAGGPIVILTSHDSVTETSLLGKLEAKGIDKFIAYEIPIDAAAAKYGGHFNVTKNDLHESDDLRVLDYNGERAFRLFNLQDLGQPTIHDPGPRAGHARDDTW